jgi:hypothetical protein
MSEKIQGATGAQYEAIDLKQFQVEKSSTMSTNSKQPVSSFERALRELIREEVLKALAERDKA